MARVPESTVLLIKESLQAYGITVQLETARDTLVAARQIILEGKTSSAVETQTLVISALVPFKQLILEHSRAPPSSWDSDEWSSILWDCFTHGMAKTSNGKRCLAIANDEQQWAFIMEQVLQETHDTTTASVGPWWLSRRMMVCWLWACMAMLAALLWVATLTGRQKVCMLMGATLFGISGDAWRRYGPEQLWATQVIVSTPTSPEVLAPPAGHNEGDADSIHTATSQLHRENEQLKQDLENIRRQSSLPLPPPAGAPPLPAAGLATGFAEVMHSQLDAARTFAAGDAGTAQASLQAARCAACAATLSPAAAFCSTCGTATQPDAARTTDKPKKPQFEILYEPGTHIIFKDLKTPEELNGTEGTVVETQGDGKYTVSSHTGALLKGLAAKNLILKVHVSANDSYAPMTGNYEGLQQQAKLLRMLLENRAAQASINPRWSEQYWNEVASIESSDGLHTAMKALLQGHGYLGAGSKSAPRSEQLAKALKSFEITGAPTHGVAAQLFEQLAYEDSGEQNSDIDNWHSQLPTDMNRAGPEIYRSIRSSGCGSVRDWVCQLFPIDQRSSASFTDLFSAASMIDFRLAKEQAERDKIKVLSTCDMCEVNLRRLAAFLHLKRTGDAAASTHMLAIQAPGTMTDVAPTWLVSESSTHSKAEHQRGERAKAQKGPGKGKPAQASTSSTTKGDNKKGKKGGKSGGKGATGDVPSG
jgi:hypothetical protein